MSQARGIMAKMCVSWWSLPFPVKRVNTWNISWLWVETKYYAIRRKAFYLLNMLSMLDFFITVTASVTGSNLKEEGKRGLSLWWEEGEEGCLHLI